MTYILFVLLFLLPFLIVPLGASQFEIPKVIAAEILIELLLFIFLLKHSPTLFLKKKYLLFLGIFLLSCIHLLFFRTEISLFGNSFRLQGIFLLWHLILLALLSSRISLPKIPSVLPCLLLSLEVGATQLLGNTIVNRAFGTLGEPNALAATAIFLWSFVIFQREEKTKPMFIVLAFLLTCSIIFLSGSRSGMLALTIQTVFFLFTLIKKIPFHYSVCIGFLFFLATLSIPFFTPQNEYENRVEVWKIAFKGGFERPVLGGGFGNLEKIFHDSAVRINLPIQYYYVDSCHNIFLDFWFQGGIIGVGLFVLLLLQTVKHYTSQKNRLGIMLLLGLLTVMSFNPVSAVTLVAFWWLIGNSFHA